MGEKKGIIISSRDGKNFLKYQSLFLKVRMKKISYFRQINPFLNNTVQI